jgi:hypothetical protein
LEKREYRRQEKTEDRIQNTGDRREERGEDRIQETGERKKRGVRR